MAQYAQVIPTVRQDVCLSHSQKNECQRCWRRWAYTKLIGLKPDEDKWNLYYGSGVHEGIENLIKGNDMAGSVNAAKARMQKDGGTEQDMFEMAPAALEGFSRHFLPGFLQAWQPIDIEGGFEYQIGPGVKFRGFRDLVARHRTDGRLGMTDWKTTGSYDGGDIAKNVATNEQLAIYSLSWAREHGEWPQMCGLGFLAKPRLKKLEDVVKRLREDHSLYFYKPTMVNPLFANFAIEVERAAFTWGQQALRYAQDFDQRGYGAIEDMPPNFGECTKYGKRCGFYEGCMSGNPAHRNLLACQQRQYVQAVAG